MQSTRVNTPDGIEWYVERFTPAHSARGDEPVVLIPSGEGDCGNLQRLGILLAESGYHAISFDNPGFSRTRAPKEAYSTMNPRLVAHQVMGLLDELQIDKAAFGGSSGGGAVLAIAALYPDRVRASIVHEVALSRSPIFAEQRAKSDEEISEWCSHFFANHFIEQDANSGRAKWDALGAEYHARLRVNFVTWVRHMFEVYVTETMALATTESLRAVPTFWTVGGMSGRARWAANFEVAEKAGIRVRTDVVDCLHFPNVSVPEKLRDWIVECMGQTEQGVDV